MLTYEVSDDVVDRNAAGCADLRASTGNLLGRHLQRMGPV